MQLISYLYTIFVTLYYNLQILKNFTIRKYLIFKYINLYHVIYFKLVYILC